MYHLVPVVAALSRIVACLPDDLPILIPERDAAIVIAVPFFLGDRALPHAQRDLCGIRGDGYDLIDPVERVGPASQTRSIVAAAFDGTVNRWLAAGSPIAESAALKTPVANQLAGG